MEHTTPPSPAQQLERLIDRQRNESAVVLSDFDHTLCYKYSFDPDTNDHLPYIEPDVVEAAEDTHLVIATGRRANSGSLRTIWQEGLLPKNRPIIAENGGVMVYYNHGRTKFLDFVPPYMVRHIVGVKEALEAQASEIEQDEELVVKLGRTMLIARLQDESGETNPEAQVRLAEAIKPLLPSTDLRIVDNRVSLAIQHHSVNKGAAFRHYLRMRGIDQHTTTIIGMGDGKNDQEIFTAADIRVGFSPVVRSMVQVEHTGEAASAMQTLRAVGDNFEPA